ncbi:transposase [Sulfitobacter sp. KE37]|uniref:transposase n=1 Tax=unclassified Sulfitobacter TaxID=196795 RepID=UPI0023E19D1B|nr:MULTISPECIES: transposase [unclassified Sulfitobacter]MDF3352066.1 transposase [Sulfitobacter sp. KE12]MDF3355695.1 transposase [Sulfitobacter sp. KE27]MDF3370376.1 transposase [Sulfitobacter sp. Ks43]MDF3374027.1 transposase [Sulfitobacter sp. KS8]MDF3377661.1 transposase [Sulfitobacter sp. KE37]
MCATNSFLRSLGVEIYASGHRRWSDTAKAQAVADTLEVGATVNAVAERYGILPNQLSAWRRQAKQGKLLLPAPDADAPLFAPLVVSAGPEEATEALTFPNEAIRLIFGEIAIELPLQTSASRIAEIAHALDASSC